MTKPLLTLIVAFLEACKAVFWTFPAEMFVGFVLFVLPILIGLAFWLLILVAVVKVVVWVL